VGTEVHFNFNSNWKKMEYYPKVGVNCLKFDCSTINWLTLLTGNQLLDTKFIKMLESSKSWLNWIRADDKNIVNCSNPVLNCCQPFFLINYFTETARIQSARHFLQLKLSNIFNSSRFMIYIDPSETTRHFFCST
jgi:hypothetical protein